MIRQLLAIVGFAKPATHKHHWVVREFTYRGYTRDSTARATCECGEELTAFGTYAIWRSAADGAPVSGDAKEAFINAWHKHQHDTEARR